MHQLREWVQRLLAFKSFWYAVLFGVFFLIEIGLLILSGSIDDRKSGFFTILLLGGVSMFFISLAAGALRLILGLQGKEMWKQAARFFLASGAAVGFVVLLKMQVGKPPETPPGLSRQELLDTITLKVELGRALSERYELTEADAAFREAEALAKAGNEGLSLELEAAWAKHEFRAGRFQPALIHALLGAKLSPRRSDLLYLVGHLRERFKKTGPGAEKNRLDVARFFEAAFRLDGDNYPALAAWARSEGARDFAAAVRGLQQRVSPRRQPRLYHWARAEMLASSGRWKESLRSFDKALESVPALRHLAFRSEILLSQGKVRELAGQTGRALQSYEGASSAASREGWFEAGRLLFGMGRYFEAERIVLRLLSVAPEYPGAHALLGRTYRRLGEPELARGALAQALKENPNALSAAVELAGLRARMGSYGEAWGVLSKFFTRRQGELSDWLEPVVEEGPDSGMDSLEQAILIAADSLGRLGRTKEAKQLLSRGIQLFGAHHSRALAAALKRY